eukprot:6046304-Pleurochrysis_carterae.AAC.1
MPEPEILPSSLAAQATRSPRTWHHDLIVPLLHMRRLCCSRAACCCSWRREVRRVPAEWIHHSCQRLCDLLVVVRAQHSKLLLHKLEQLLFRICGIVLEGHEASSLLAMGGRQLQSTVLRANDQHTLKWSYALKRTRERQGAHTPR